LRLQKSGSEGLGWGRKERVVKDLFGEDVAVAKSSEEHHYIVKVHCDSVLGNDQAALKHKMQPPDGNVFPDDFLQGIDGVSPQAYRVAGYHRSLFGPELYQRGAEWGKCGCSLLIIINADVETSQLLLTMLNGIHPFA
jgi:hypothetical protein